MIIDVIETVKIALYTCAIIFPVLLVAHWAVDKITERKIQKIVDKGLDGASGTR